MLLSSGFAKNEFEKIKIGGRTHTNKLNLSDLHAIPFPLPPLAEQHRIVEKIEELMTLCDQLEEQINTRRTDSQKLLESVLHEILQTDTQNLNDHAVVH